MMYLTSEPMGIKSSPSRSSPFQQSEKSSLSLVSHSKCRRRYNSSDEEDDSRDRQSHWKRIKASSDDYPRGSTRTLIRYTERDYERPSSPCSRVVQAFSRSNPRPCQRVTIVKGKEEDVGGLRLCSGRSKEWHVTGDMPLRGDGGTASSSHDIVPKRKNESMMMSTVGDAASRSSLMMCEPTTTMVVREKHTARRAPAPVERGHEVRVSGREALGDGLSFEDSRRHADDDYIPGRMGSDTLYRRRRGGETMNRESSRGFGDHQTEALERARRVEFDFSVDNGKGRASRSGNDEGKEYGARLANRTAAAAAGLEEKERAVESERRQEKRERWAEKERDLEKELEKENNMPNTQSKPSVTVVDYSHKFTVAKAPISAAAKPVEVDPHRLCQRQKQIDYGKNTLGYERYTESVPRYQRTKAHPRTPDIRQVCSKRSWDGQIRKWRRLLHEYDPPKGEDEEDPDLTFAPTRGEQQEGSATEDCPMGRQSEFAEDPDLKIYEGWSDDEC